MHIPFLCWEIPLKKKMATHSSILVWKIPSTEEPSMLQSMGLQRVKHDWVTKQQQQLRPLVMQFQDSLQVYFQTLFRLLLLLPAFRSPLISQPVVCSLYVSFVNFAYFFFRALPGFGITCISYFVYAYLHP